MSVPTEFSIDSNTDLAIAQTRIKELSNEVDQLKASCAYAEERIATLIEARDGWAKQYREFENFWAGVNGEMIEQAERRGWCAEFDSILEELARSAPHHITIQRRQREVEMEITVNYTSSATRTIIVMVRGNDDDAYNEAANDWIESHDFDPADGSWVESGYGPSIDEVVVNDVSE